MKAVLGEQFENMLENFVSSNQHAMTIIGAELSSLCNEICQKLQSIKPEIIVLRLTPEKSSITIDQIREIKHSFSLKQAGNQERVLIVENAETMTHEAQNSLLKLLEEPPKGVRFILLSHYKAGLLSTILSRSRLVQMRPLSQKEAMNYVDKNELSELEVKRAYVIADGMPSKLFALLGGTKSDYTDSIEQAKSLLVGAKFSRIASVDYLAKDKIRAIVVLEAIDDVLRAVSHTASSSSEKIKQIALKRNAIYSARTALQKNTNTKLVLLDVFMSL